MMCVQAVVFALIWLSLSSVVGDGVGIGTYVGGDGEGVVSVVGDGIGLVVWEGIG